ETCRERLRLGGNVLLSHDFFYSVTNEDELQWWVDNASRFRGGATGPGMSGMPALPVRAVACMDDAGVLRDAVEESSEEEEAASRMEDGDEAGEESEEDEDEGEDEEGSEDEESSDSPFFYFSTDDEDEEEEEEEETSVVM
ncbi:MAG: hypothetical protein Q9187_009057, partial [Circinaria calcarea]